MRACDLTCREVLEFLDRYLERELAPDEAERFDAHLAVCPPCVDYLQSYRVTSGLVASLARDESELADGIPDELVEAVVRARAGLVP